MRLASIGALTAVLSLAQLESGISSRLELQASTHGTELVWIRPGSENVILDQPSLTSAEKNLEVRLVSQQATRDTAVQTFSIARRGEGQIGTYVAKYSLFHKADEDAVTEKSTLHFGHPLRVDLLTAQSLHLTPNATRSASAPRPTAVVALSLPLRDGVVKYIPLAYNEVQSAYFFLGRDSTASRGAELALPLIGVGFNGFAGGTFAISTDPYWGAQFNVQRSSAPDDKGPTITISSNHPGALAPVIDETRTKVFDFHKSEIAGMFAGFYDGIPEIHPSPSWIQGIQLDYYDYISSYESQIGQGWYHDVKTLAEKIPVADRGRVVLCLHGYYDYVGRFCYDPKEHRLIKNWVSYDKDGRAIPMSLAEVHKRIAFAKNFGFHVVLLFGDGTATDTSTPYYRDDWVIRDEHGKYPSRGFWEWRPDVKIKIPPRHVLGKDQYPTNHIMDPALPAVREWFLGYTDALLNEYGRELDGFVWDEAFLIERGWMSYTGHMPTYSDSAMMHLVSDISQRVQEWRNRNPNLVFLVADNGRTPYGLVAHGTWQDSACVPQMWGPGFLLNYRNSLWSCLWFPVTLERFNQFAADSYGLPQGLSNGWGDNQGPSEMPVEILDRVIQRFLARIRPGSDRTRCLLTSAPPLPEP